MGGLDACIARSLTGNRNASARFFTDLGQILN